MQGKKVCALSPHTNLHQGYAGDPFLPWHVSTGVSNGERGVETLPRVTIMRAPKLHAHRLTPILNIRRSPADAVVFFHAINSPPS